MSVKAMERRIEKLKEEYKNAWCFDTKMDILDEIEDLEAKITNYNDENGQEV